MASETMSLYVLIIFVLYSQSLSVMTYTDQQYNRPVYSVHDIRNNINIMHFFLSGFFNQIR